MSEHEDLLLAELPSDPAHHLLRIGDHALGRHRRGESGTAIQEERLTGTALIPLDDREVFLPTAGEPPAHRNRYIAGSAMEEEQHRIALVRPTDRYPLLDATDPDGLEALN